MMGQDWNDTLHEADGRFTVIDFEKYMQDAPPPEEAPFDNGEAVDHDQVGGADFADGDVSRWVGIDPPEQKFTVAGLVLPALVEALWQAESEARAAGLLVDSEQEHHVEGATILDGG